MYVKKMARTTLMNPVRYDRLVYWLLYFIRILIRFLGTWQIIFKDFGDLLRARQWPTGHLHENFEDINLYTKKSPFGRWN